MCLPRNLQDDPEKVPSSIESVLVQRIPHQIHRTKYRACLWAVLIPVAMGSVMSLPVSVFAADGKRVAFVVGIGTYDTLPDDKQLKNSVNDAEGVSVKLAEIGFQVTTASNLTRQGFYAKWLEVLNSLTEEDTFVLFYSGHGIQIRQQNYLLPRDIPPIDRQREDLVTTEAISLTGVLNDLTQGRGDKHPPKRAVVIIDACRDNPFILPGSKSIKTPSGLAKPSSTEGLFVIYSALENSVSLDRLPNDEKTVKYSVFTRVLLPLLGRQDLTLQNLSLKLKKEVSTLAKNAGRRQLPTYYDGTDGEPFCLPGCAAKADKGTVALKEDVSITVQSTLPSEKTGKDGAPMVVIPNGNSWMGSPDEEGDKDEHPRHSVWLSAFYLDKYEVTNRRFEQFVHETGHRTTAEQKGKAWTFTATGKYEEVSGAHWRKPEGGETVFDSNREQHPVVSVSWEDAQTYCSWAGKRLPTEAEFEYATRGGTGTKYWWGNSNPGTHRVANVADESAKRQYLDWTIMTGYDDGYVRTAPVGSFEANPFGLYDMTGNVWEWVADRYDETYYENSHPYFNPQGPSRGEYRVIRGGSWNVDPDYARSATRGKGVPTAQVVDVGFRCAKDVPK
jgi:formylglycine-generating enzyme